MLVCFTGTRLSFAFCLFCLLGKAFFCHILSTWACSPEFLVCARQSRSCFSLFFSMHIDSAFRTYKEDPVLCTRAFAVLGKIPFASTTVGNSARQSCSCFSSYNVNWPLAFSSHLSCDCTRRSRSCFISLILIDLALRLYEKSARLCISLPDKKSYFFGINVVSGNIRLIF